MVYNWFGTGFVPLIISYTLSFTVLFIGSITDLKTREVPDWLNYGLIISGFMLNLLFSVIYLKPAFIINSTIGFLIFFGVAYFMFYAGQWGGGDSKMLMGLGAMIGFDLSFKAPVFLFAFFINVLLAGAVYGLLWSIFFAFRNKRKFFREFKKLLSAEKTVKIKKFLVIITSLYLVFILASMLKFRLNRNINIMFLSFLLLLAMTFYLWIFVKAIEKSSMYKLVAPAKLTEGDWIANDVIVNKQYICGPKDLGIEKKQIKRLIQLYRQGKVKNILIKEGVPFVPSFFIAFIATLIFGNPLAWML